jgi:peroxiredoxin
MNIKPRAALGVVIAMLSAQCLTAADKPDVTAELNALVRSINAKTDSGPQTEVTLYPEIKQFDTLLEEHKGEKTDAVARILFMKGMLYDQVLREPEKADLIMEQLVRDFPDTKIAQDLKPQVEAKQIQRSLKPGLKFPDFSEKDLAGRPLSLANYKGKVVLLDFWATWCMPCRMELPNVLKTYETYHKDGFEVVGICLDEDKDKATSFIQEQKVTWPQYFDGKGWQNKLARKYGVFAIPATYLLDGQGVIIGKNLRGESLQAAVAKALGKKPEAPPAGALK